MAATVIPVSDLDVTATPAPADHVCEHTPPCPLRDDPAALAAKLRATHPEQGWSLLCNGIVLFMDGGWI
jgi:hypothetical protein